MLLLILFSGCSISKWVENGFKVGPNYQSPSAVVSDQWIDENSVHIDVSTENDALWWSSFDDPILEQLIETAVLQNLTLKEAGWRIEQARAIRAVTAGNLFPQSQFAFGEYQRLLESETVASPSPFRAFDDWSAGVTMSWELDLWGRYRRSVAAADANVGLVVGDYDAILLCLIADVASAYTEYRTAQLQLKYALQNLAIQEDSLKLTKEKADQGATGYVGVYLAESSLETTRAGIPNIKVALRQASNRLCTLLGLPTQELADLLQDQPIPVAPDSIAVGIPANLLRRRPDVRAAERAVASQSEQIGIAMADLYPAFSITGTFSVESEKFTDLFESASTSGVASPGFQWNLLNYGRIANNIKLQEFGLQELIVTYQNTVLSANQEVEDSMVAYLQAKERYAALEKSVAATEKSLDLLTLSFEEGDIDFSAVFLLQGALVNAQNQLAISQGDIIGRLIDLYKALGGGWETRCVGTTTISMDSSVASDEGNQELVDNSRLSLAQELPNESTNSMGIQNAQDWLQRAFSRNEPEEFSK